MKEKRRSRTKSGAGNAYLSLAIFIVIAALIIAICSAFASGGSYSFVKTVYQGNGIYNGFFSTDLDADLDIPVAETEQYSEIPDYLENFFGEVKYSPIACLMRDDGIVLNDIDKDRQFFPASITKVMTALIVYEKITDLENTILTIDQDTINYCAEQGAATCGFSVGETVSAKELLYGSLIASGAEATVTLAKYVGGSEEAFADLMNAKAEEFGMTNTHFVNSTGLHDARHYSTAYDLALMMREALKNDFIREIMQMNSYLCLTGSQHTDGLWVVSTVYRAFRNSGIDMGYVKGGKTGFTDDALLCLASFAEIEINGETETFILVTLGAGDGGNDIPYHVYDAASVFNHADIQLSETE